MNQVIIIITYYRKNIQNKGNLKIMMLILGLSDKKSKMILNNISKVFFKVDSKIGSLNLANTKAGKKHNLRA